MRVVRPDGVVSAPIAGVPGVKSVAAQGLHDLLLDPDFTRNRTIYFTYFAPPKGEAPAVWPIEFFYERVWTKPLAERRTMQIGMETVARAKLSADERSLTDVETIAELKAFLLWCTLINYAVLIVWFGALTFAHEWMFRLHTRWFRISREMFDGIPYGAMATAR